ncbi:hypothetical protein EJ05DRAFT_483531 [Pseudovirgaria hyperparasitica]|uniref:F-box domain-containing protein n=1 Tax=Pseudovirgaria hyperparasitica TaxID=470096 RepID=A0A6A6WEJ2_9PEZI|nr:uncharacterized protein EJ05DRAFT_483531 [Pseudovirgaria hyperparasitica]KAF2761133.1 hypothetical protein EJ05DRAFT_483531 [Pseudovirgaria hyperparasitica]
MNAIPHQPPPRSQSSNMPSLLRLPSELILSIFYYLEPLSLSAIKSTCRTLRKLVQSNDALLRTMIDSYLPGLPGHHADYHGPSLLHYFSQLSARSLCQPGVLSPDLTRFLNPPHRYHAKTAVLLPCSHSGLGLHFHAAALCIDDQSIHIFFINPATGVRRVSYIAPYPPHPYRMRFTDLVFHSDPEASAPASSESPPGLCPPSLSVLYSSESAVTPASPKLDKGQPFLTPDGLCTARAFTLVDYQLLEHEEAMPVEERGAYEEKQDNSLLLPWSDGLAYSSASANLVSVVQHDRPRVEYHIGPPAYPAKLYIWSAAPSRSATADNALADLPPLQQPSKLSTHSFPTQHPSFLSKLSWRTPDLLELSSPANRMPASLYSLQRGFVILELPPTHLLLPAPNPPLSFIGPRQGLLFTWHHNCLPHNNPRCLTSTLHLLVHAHPPISLPGLEPGIYLTKALSTTPPCAPFDVSASDPSEPVHQRYVARLVTTPAIDVQHISSAGLCIAFSPLRARIAVAAWGTVCVFAVEARGLLDVGGRDRRWCLGFEEDEDGDGDGEEDDDNNNPPRPDSPTYHPSNASPDCIVDIAPSLTLSLEKDNNGNNGNSPSTNVIYNIAFSAEEELWAWTSGSGLVKWHFGAGASGMERTCGIEDDVV